MIFYVYIIFRPWNGSPCYVGKGKGRRWEAHDHLGHLHRNKRLSRIIDKSKRLGSGVLRVKIRENLSEIEAFQIEKAFIAAIGRADKGLGPLVNLTDGGEGISNPSNEVREIMSKKRRIARLGTKHSLKTRIAIGLGNLGKTISEESKIKMSNAKLGKSSGPISSKRREAIRAALLIYWENRRRNGLPLKHLRRDGNAF